MPVTNLKKDPISKKKSGLLIGNPVYKPLDILGVTTHG